MGFQNWTGGLPIRGRIDSAHLAFFCVVASGPNPSTMVSPGRTVSLVVPDRYLKVKHH